MDHAFQELDIRVAVCVLILLIVGNVTVKSIHLHNCSVFTFHCVSSGEPTDFICMVAPPLLQIIIYVLENAHFSFGCSQSCSQ